MARSSSGQGYLVLSQGIRGSNPLRATKQERRLSTGERRLSSHLWQNVILQHYVIYGSDYMVLPVAAALKFAGWDYKFVFSTGAHDHMHSAAIFPDTMRWLWRDRTK